MFLLDTNVVAEVRKGPRCDPAVATWYWAQSDTDLYLSVMVLSEIRRGIERLERGGRRREASAFEKWLNGIVESFGERILPVDRRVADRWGRMMAEQTLPIADALMAATALVNDFTLVSRNVKDVSRTPARYLNPFTASASPPVRR
jgi:toxin FitB